ncbi:Peptidyl-tRNA hydrolase [Trypanosoma melophagium]|uniref:Peptidyl-tRNA hydrolase n=1 Tax=Trypanosoma melophagium TaxID=715481 RepID=UPI00351A497E|nr:Peptidyl-tRNA hydrolase [Trypanosoma melophagium]
MDVGSEILGSTNVMRALFVNLLGFFLGFVVAFSVKWFFQRWRSTSIEFRNPSLAKRAAQALKEMKRQQKPKVETGNEGAENNDGKNEWSTEESEEENYDSSEEDSEFERMEELRLKMVLVVRRDVKKMSTQDTVVSAASAAAELVHKIQKDIDHIKWQEWYLWWNRVGCAKITLKCPDAETLQRIVLEADTSGIPWCSAITATSSQFSSSSSSSSALENMMVAALGPAPSAFLDPITGSLKLLS